MIDITFEESGNAIRMQLRGHAGSGREGHDLVCAAASILAYTAAQNAVCLHREDKLLRAPLLRLEKGDAEIVAEPKAEFYDEALYGFLICQIGYTLLAHGYPESLRLTGFARRTEEARSA